MARKVILKDSSILKVADASVPQWSNGMTDAIRSQRMWVPLLLVAFSLVVFSEVADSRRRRREDVSSKRSSTELL